MCMPSVGLTHHEIEKPDGSPLADDVHAQPQDGQVPAWVKQVFEFYVDGQVFESEILNVQSTS